MISSFFLIVKVFNKLLYIAVKQDFHIFAAISYVP